MPLDPSVESHYYQSRNFSPEHSAAVRRHYLQHVDGRDLLVELGCGRGEFLQLAAGVVKRVRGVDSDPEMVELARARGLDVQHADVGEYLRSTDDRPDVVFAAHLVEHLTVEQSFDCLKDIAAVIPAGGRVILVTPNPACLAMLTADFWSDPTHVRPYTIELLSFLAEEAGFTIVAQGGNPLDVPGPPPHLLTADLMPAWGRLSDEWGALPVLSKATSDAAMLLEELSRLRHAVSVLDSRLFELRHLAVHVGQRLNDTLNFLYPENEIYVVGERSG